MSSASRPQTKPFHLFAYGTLMNPSVFRAVLGRRLVQDPRDADGVDAVLARDAVLDGYKKISPDRTYMYAVPDPHGRIRGYVIGPLPPESMANLRRYEGRNYYRRTMTVQTPAGPQKAYAFVANMKHLEHHFGYEFHDPFKQEILLSLKIDEVLDEALRAPLQADKDRLFTRRAMAELRGPTIRDLVRTHFDAGGVSDYAIRHSLRDAPLPNFDRIRADSEAKALAPHYLTMVVRQVIFNQIEDNIRRDFRYELDQLNPGRGYYERTISSLAALSILNAAVNSIALVVNDCLTEMGIETHDLMDFVKWAIVAADTVYHPKAAKQVLEYIGHHTSPGYVPLGAELEFSNIGHGVIADPEGQTVRDARYDGFIYFADFGLNALTWKLGGHIDDHRDKASDRPRRGFFETALGNLSIGQNISKPVTNDPWVLSQFVHAVRRFYGDVVPHSMHVSMQLRGGHRPDPNRLLPTPVMKCLFALAGDPQVDETGKLRIQRLVGQEIIGHDPGPHMLFSDIRKRYSRQDPLEDAVSVGRSGTLVQQYRFLRLSAESNYETIVMALKGIQIALSPGSFLTSVQYSTSPRHHAAFDELMAWAVSPAPLSRSEIDGFLENVHDGLMREHNRRPAHNPAYVTWSLNQLRRDLMKFNELAGGKG